MSSAPAIPHFSRIRVLLGVIAALAVGGLLATGLSAPAFADTTYNFTIKITNKAGAPLAGVEVFPVAIGDGAQIPSDEPQEALPVTGKPGYYEMIGLQARAYSAFLFPTGTSAATAYNQLAGGESDFARAATFTPSATNTFLAVSLAGNGTVAGVVTNPVGALLRGAYVQSFSFDGTAWTPYSSASTDAKGHYSLTDLDPGSYKLEYYPLDGATQPVFSGAKASLDSAIPVYVNLGATVTVNAKFVAGTGTISGVLKADFGGGDIEPMDSAIVAAYPITSYDPEGYPLTADMDEAIYSKPSTVSGSFAITGIPAGKYVLQVQPAYYNEPVQWIGTPYVGAGGDLDPHLLIPSAKIWTVTAGSKQVSSPIIEADPEQGGSLTVHVYNFINSASLGGIHVVASRYGNPNDSYEGTTDSSGAVTFGVEPMSGDGTIQPGWFWVSLSDPTEQYEPQNNTSVFVGFGSNVDPHITIPVATHPGFSSAPSIAEASTKVGTSYTVAATAARSDATLRFQWLRNGLPIFGATTDTYIAQGGDLGTQISVRVSANSLGFDPVYGYAAVGSPMPSVETAGDAPVSLTHPLVTAPAPAFVGTTLQAKVGTWNSDGLRYTYQWLRNGIPITGATHSTYVMTADDTGLAVTVAISATKPGYADAEPVVSDNSVTSVLHPAATVVKAPTFAATAVKSGVITTTTYKVNPGTWSLAGVTFAYAWTAPDGTGGSLGTNTTMSLPTNAFTTFPSEPITVTVTAKKVGYADSVPVRLIVRKATLAFADATAPTISDVTTSTAVDATSTPLVGDKLSVTDPGAWSLPAPDSAIAPDSFVYAWFRKVGAAAPVAIAGATTSSYTLTSVDAHAVLSVRVTPVSSLYAATANTFGVGTGTINPILVDAPATVSLVGVAAVGGTLTGTVGWPTTGVVTSYQWYSCTVSVLKDCTSTTMFTKVAAQVKAAYAPTVAGAYVYLGVTGTKVGYASGTAVSAITPIAAANVVTQLAAPTVTVSADAKAHVGVAAAAVTGRFAGPASVKTYQWQVCSVPVCADGDWAPITGAKAASYVPTAAVYGTGTSSIRVEQIVTVGPAALPTFIGTYASAARPLATGTLKLVAAPKVTKTVVGGVTKYTVTPGSWLPAASTGTVIYHWLVNGVDSGIADASQTPIDSTTITPQSSVTLSTSFATQGYPAYGSTILAQAGTITPPVAGSTAIVGSAYGTTLSIGNPFTYPTSAGVTPVLTYQWYANNVAIAGAVHPTFVPPSAAYVAHNITVRVTAATPYFVAASYLSPAVYLAAGSFGTPALPTISSTGLLAPGTVATAHLGNYGTTGITFAYAWQWSATGATWTTITGAKLTTFTPLSAAYAGGQLRFIVLATKAGYPSSYLISLPVPVAYPPLATIDPASITGTPAVGSVVTANPGVWNTAAVTFTYQWTRNGIDIPGATTATMALLADSYGDQIAVRIVAGKVGYPSVTVTSDNVAVGQAVAPIATALPKITGTATAGYTVSTGTWNVDGLVLTFEWSANGAAIAGATTDTYVPVAPTPGQSITATVVATRSGYASGSATSIAVVIPLTN